MVQTPVVEELNVTVNVDDAVAASMGDEPKLWLPGFVKVMVWLALGVTALVAPEAAPAPTELVAVTVKV
jgi:hypothetical protein